MVVKYSREGEACLDQKLSVKSDSVVWEYDQASDFTITQDYYLKFFENSNDKDCPFDQFLVSWTNKNGVKNLDNLIKMKDALNIGVDFQALY